MTTNTSTFGFASPDPAERQRAYSICQERGHTSAMCITVGWGPAKYTCRFCGTTYWTETIEHEEGAPE